MRRQFGKKCAALLLAFAVLFPMGHAQAADQPEGTGNVEIAYNTSIWKEGPLWTDPSLMQVPQAAANVEFQNSAQPAVRWIDRIVLPQYAIDFYNALSRASDGVGNDDYLIDDEFFVYDGHQYQGNEPTGTWVTFGDAAGIVLNARATTESDGQISANMMAAIDAFIQDHPEVFWFSGATPYSSPYQQQPGNRSRVLLTSMENGGFDIRIPSYQNGEKIRRDMAVQDNQVNQILQNIPAGADDAQKIVYFSEYLTQNNEYNTAEINDMPDMAFRGLTALMGKKGVEGPVCESYAKALKILCDHTDIPCVLVSGNSNRGTKMGHAWNHVEVGQNWYGVDITWNDPTGGLPGNLSGAESHDWTLLGATEFNKQHTSENCMNFSGIQRAEFLNEPALAAENYFTNPTYEKLPDTDPARAMKHHRKSRGVVITENHHWGIVLGKTRSAVRCSECGLEISTDQNHVSAFKCMGPNEVYIRGELLMKEKNPNQILVASYDANGKMTGIGFSDATVTINPSTIEFVMKEENGQSKEVLQGNLGNFEGTIQVEGADRAAAFKVFFLNGSAIPVTEMTDPAPVTVPAG